ncbi:hypothetical protein A8C56_07995 [Niabella ginsenosidivorans]|uniref:Glycosyltransferase 2-like domain-containing protein n=1 Tax=Niabella ginsenosidivorans TaxID=1176587 RepID=A0A1A9I2L0_9BACT|nr:glycosyltransferase family 2 protein [Niabella ginsenosidivorans]ANH80931.1 hypothetical protein A8C56_07995 [Niabella ginsenosidivorans]
MAVKKKISVIIPFYSGVDWLEEAVQSVLDQTHYDHEIIVVNDGSPENIASFLSKYERHIIYKFKENGGPASARNLALKCATGDYIAFLDSDDVWLPLKSEKQISFMETTGAMWSHTCCYNWYPSLDKFVLTKNETDYGNVYLQSFISLRINTPSLVIDKRCFDAHPELTFYEDMRYAQDAALWSRIAYYYPLALLKEPLVKVRQRGTNAASRAVVRFNAKSIIYSKIKKGQYKNVPTSILFIYKQYVIGNTILNSLKKSFKTKESTLEFFGKVFWCIPFIQERIIAFRLRSKNIKLYKSFVR